MLPTVRLPDKHKALCAKKVVLTTPHNDWAGFIATLGEFWRRQWGRKGQDFKTKVGTAGAYITSTIA
jgi:hypothetical protein